MAWKKIKAWFSLYSLIGLALGALGGWIYYIKIGCSSGSCPIWSNPWMSIIWGAAFGYLLGDLFTRKPKDTNS